MASRDSIKVVCRIRPENALEMAGSYKRCVEHNDKDISISVSILVLPFCLTIDDIIVRADIFSEWYEGDT